MAFEDRLTASFRGVTFLLEIVGGKGGRRAVPHAYPKRESGWTEDNGAVLNEQSIAGRVIGEDYLQQLQTLLAVLNQPGPGELIHPWWGVQQVQVGNVEHKFEINTDEMATVSFQVFEAGKSLFNYQKPDTAAELADEAAAAQDAANSEFENDWDTGALDGIGEMVDTFLDDLDEFTRNLPSLPEELREWTDRLMRIKDSVGKLLAFPGELARAVMGLVEDLKGVVTDPIRALDVYDQVGNRWKGMRAELSVTGGLSRNIVSEGGQARSAPSITNPVLLNRVVNNSNTFKELILTSTAISKAAAIGASPLDQTVTSQPETVNGLTGADRQAVITAEQLQALGNQLADELGELSIEAVERGSSDVWRSLRRLRNAVINDTRERAAMLPRIRRVSPTVTTPVSLISWQETGSAENREAIVRRNGLKNPAFILPSDTIEVLNG